MNGTKEGIVQFEVNDAIADIVVNRPSALNALSREVLERLEVCFAELQSRSEVRVAVISGAGDKAFVAGADVAAMHASTESDLKDFIELGQRVMRAIETARMPVIAAVGGFCLGGGMELALACDIIVASERAKFGQPEVNLGIIPGFGGTQRLIHRAGLGTARRLCLTGDMIAANEAMTLGLIDKLVAPEELSEVVRKMATTVTEKGPLAVAKAKEVIRLSQDENLTAGLSMEVAAFCELFSTADRKEGMGAFLEKRRASFTGS